MQMNEPVPAHPPRRAERTTPLRASIGERVGSGLIAGACATVLALAAWLAPASAGHGTHTQLGMAPCVWAVTLDKPCPTCGMTTSFASAGEGQWLTSIATQPMGTLLVLLTAVVFWGALAQTITGARIGATVQPALRPRSFIVMGLLLLAAWGYKIITW